MSMTVNSSDADQVIAHYQRLIEISQQLNSTLDLGSLLKKIISAARELTNTEAASIMLIEPSTGDLRFEIASNIAVQDMDEIIIPKGSGIAEETIQTIFITMPLIRLRMTPSLIPKPLSNPRPSIVRSKTMALAMRGRQ